MAQIQKHQSVTSLSEVDQVAEIPKGGMYRKPFRTPFLKVNVNKRGSDEENQGAGLGASGTEFPPKKKFKQDHGGEEDEKVIKGVVQTTPVSRSTMRPLLSLKCSVVKNAGQKVSEKVEEPDAGAELYFNVLWRKYTTKKYVYCEFTGNERFSYAKMWL